MSRFVHVFTLSGQLVSFSSWNLTSFRVCRHQFWYWDPPFAEAWHETEMGHQIYAIILVGWMDLFTQAPLRKVGTEGLFVRIVNMYQSHYDVSLISPLFFAFHVIIMDYSLNFSSPYIHIFFHFLFVLWGSDSVFNDVSPWGDVSDLSGPKRGWLSTLECITTIQPCRQMQYICTSGFRKVYRSMLMLGTMWSTTYISEIYKASRLGRAHYVTLCV